MKKTWLKYLGYIVGAIILGAVGSGVWDKILSPIWNMLIDGIVKLFSLVSVSFTNSIYYEAAKGFHEQHSLMLLMFFLGMTCGVYLGLLVGIIKVRRRDEDEADTLKDTIYSFFRSNRNFIGFSFIVLIILILFVFTSIQMSYVNKVTTNSLNSISIVAPHIGIQQTLELRSMFHSIQTSDDYKDFYEKMKKLEETFKLKLPVSAPL